MSYSGKDRRIHRVYVTRNTEYHVRHRTCVGVRDRNSGRWMRTHEALRSRVAGGIRFTGKGGVVPNDGLPAVGESVFFCADGRDLVTSTVVGIERPGREIVRTYPF